MQKGFFFDLPWLPVVGVCGTRCISRWWPSRDVAPPQARTDSWWRVGIPVLLHGSAVVAVGCAGGDLPRLYRRSTSWPLHLDDWWLIRRDIHSVTGALPTGCAHCSNPFSSPLPTCSTTLLQPRPHHPQPCIVADCRALKMRARGVCPPHQGMRCRASDASPLVYNGMTRCAPCDADGRAHAPHTPPPPTVDVDEDDDGWGMASPPRHDGPPPPLSATATDEPNEEAALRLPPPPAPTVPFVLRTTIDCTNATNGAQLPTDAAQVTTLVTPPTPPTP